MATKGSRFISFRDIESGKRPDGTYDTEIVDLVSQENTAMSDIPFKECSKGREDIITIRMGLPTAVTRSYYGGISGSKGSKKQVVNSCCTISTAIELDARLYDDTPNKEAFILDEAKIHVGVLEEKATQLLFYGDVADDPKGINGFKKTFASTATTATDQNMSADYVLNAARATGKSEAMLRSIYLVGWGPQSTHGIYPQGAAMGLQKGKLETSVWVPDPEDATKKIRMAIQELNWNLGLNIVDFRYSGRIANIELDAALNTTGMPDYVELLQRLACRIKTARSVKQSLYMDRKTWEVMSTWFFRKTMGNAVRYADLEQKKGLALMGIPVGICDALATNEPFVNPYSA